MRYLLLLTLLVSCGKDYTQVILQENPYNDNQLKAHQVLQEARIAALEARLDAYNTNFDEVVIDFGERLNNTNTAVGNYGQILDSNLGLITSALSELQTKSIALIPICNSKEYLIKTSSGVYAVFMVSNSYGTFFGKLSENVNYRTTDEIGANFKIVDSNVACL